jgi:hypothetical protein
MPAILPLRIIGAPTPSIGRFLMKLLRAALIPLAAMSLLAACSGSSSTAAPGATTGAGATTPAATVAPGATTTGGAGGATDWCLNTAAEVETALGVTGVISSGSDAPGIGGGCSYTDSAGILVYSIAVVSTGNFQETFDVAKQTPGAVPITGLGKDAVLISSAGPLAILIDNGVVSLGPTLPALLTDAAGYRTAAEALAKQAVTRLP